MQLQRKSFGVINASLTRAYSSNNMVSIRGQFTNTNYGNLWRQSACVTDSSQRNNKGISNLKT
jgi:hypothetical protein